MKKRLPLYSFLPLILSFISIIQSSKAEDFALLIGVSEYPMLPKENWLQGPVNDVILIDELLQSRFKLNKKNIQKLSGWPKNEASRPTKSNIKAAFENIAKTSKKGDNVFILMSGHGSQQPSDPDSLNIEPDGLDEVFLPADTSVWDEQSQSIQGAIVDDEVKEWTHNIRKKGAFVWIIFDSCHSGTMTRGTSHAERKNRRISPQQLVPKSSLISHAVSRGQIKTETSSFIEIDHTEELGGIVAMYAAQSIEPTFEMPLPPQGKEFHGLFTFTLAQILNQSTKALSYRDLADSVGIIYRSNGIFQPTPLIEGTGLDQEVLGTKMFNGQAPFMLTGEHLPPSAFELNGGYLQGLRQGSVVEIYPSALEENSETVIGTAIVQVAMATRSMITPYKWGDSPAAPIEKMTMGCRAKIVYEKLTLDRLKIALQTEKLGGISTLKEADLPDIFQTILKSAKDNQSHWEWVDSLKEADWILRFSKDKISLLPVTGWSRAFESDKNKASTSQADRPEFEITDGKSAKSILGKIARARQLLHIGGSTQKGQEAQMEISLIRYSSPDDKVGKKVSYESNGKLLTSGDEIAFRIKNTDQFSIDITLLFIDSEYGISSIFPESGTIDDNRIPAGKILTTPRLVVTATTNGPEQIVALGVRSSKNRIDFTCLEQASLERRRGIPSLDTPLGQLLMSAVYEKGNTRGLKRATSGDHSAKLISWWTVPKKN